ncbi:MAG: hypothetical protein JXR81_08875 [Candidatus Goldbacteria bacterium]|nr:hypothetical protein [Candidatus Goldiibacteriota bacterium]
MEFEKMKKTSLFTIYFFFLSFVVALASNESITITPSFNYAEKTKDKITVTKYKEWDDERGWVIRDEEIPDPLSLEEYILGVVRAEIYDEVVDPDAGLSVEQEKEALKAQALASMNKMYCNIKNYRIDGVDQVQACTLIESMPMSTTHTGSLKEYIAKKEIMKYFCIESYTNKYNETDKRISSDLKPFEGLFFGGNNSTTFTKSTEDYLGWANEKDGTTRYGIYNRASTGGPGITGPYPTNVHCVGMYQHGAIALAKAGKKYDEIIRHYYHPSPPILSRVVLKQDDEIIYDAGWEELKLDDDGKPTREKKFLLIKRQTRIGICSFFYILANM